MIKSLSEMHKLMSVVLRSVKDEEFSLSELRNQYNKSDIDEAVYACIEQNLITGITAGRSQEANNILFYPGNVNITYAGLAFLENN